MLKNLLNNSKVRVKNPIKVQEKLEDFIKDGFDRLMVISDFDYTITRYHDEDNNKCWTTHGVFDSATEFLSPFVTEELQKLKRKYLPIEYDPDISEAEKRPKMEDWFVFSAIQSAHNLITSVHFERTAIESLVHQTEQLLFDLHCNHVPIFIFSAGIGNIIEIFLKEHFGNMNNIHIISNMMTFDVNNKINGFEEPLIHTFSKNSLMMKRDPKFFLKVANRHNVLLMGDSLGDTHMDAGLDDGRTVLKIGFLNFNIDTLLDKYLDGFDIVLIDDQSMDIPRSISTYSNK
ncbi:unnamed protein product [Dracunculus medinensis]|uniref:5'-nucleotidase n=1 Tax=Dracunculus medinensis TaxID=318479 RepID=A0A158Q480_DRAME|nr:unnamed protein product [Dracunculus medinensis]